jgi:hypothetical protein
MNRQPIRHAFDKLEKAREIRLPRRASRVDHQDETDLQVGIVIQPGFENIDTALR